MTTATNNTQGMLTKFPFKPGIFVTPMSCTNDVLISRHQAGNSSAAEQIEESRMPAEEVNNYLNQLESVGLIKKLFGNKPAGASFTLRSSLEATSENHSFR